MSPALHLATLQPAAVSWRESKPWLQVLSHLDPRYGGLSSIVPQLCASVMEAHAPTSLAAFCLPDEQVEPSCLSPGTTFFWPVSRLAWLTDRSLQRRFREAVYEAEGVHIHGLWEQSTNVAARNARALHKPYMVSAHGMLEPWALANKGLKKRLYAALFERRNLREADCLHALTDAEAEDYRDFGCSNPIVVIPNAVHLPQDLDATAFLATFPQLRGQPLILFLGRIHFKKGLDLLVASWAEIARKWPEAHLVLAGPDSENTRAGVEQWVTQNGVANRVTFTGMLDAEMKWSAYAAATCFVLPSYSEGLSTSVLEAMAARLPVILTEQSHMPEVAERQAGWIIQPDVDDLTHALSAVLSSSPSELRKIGARGRSLVEQNYSWPSVGDRMAEVYRALGSGQTPLCKRSGKELLS